jgi:hypothetical protein
MIMTMIEDIVTMIMIMMTVITTTLEVGAKTEIEIEGLAVHIRNLQVAAHTPVGDQWPVL